MKEKTKNNIRWAAGIIFCLVVGTILRTCTGDNKPTHIAQSWEILSHSDAGGTSTYAVEVTDSTAFRTRKDTIQVLVPTALKSDELRRRVQLKYEGWLKE